MSKGTKQIRFGRVQKKIDEIELSIRVHKRSMELLPDSSEDNYYHCGYVEALEMVLQSLKELED